MIAVAAAALALGVFGTVAPSPDLEVVDRAVSDTYVMMPGDVVHWPIGVTTQDVRIEDLTIRVLVDGPTGERGADQGLADELEVELRGCPQRWDGSTCTTGDVELGSRRSVADWQGVDVAVRLPDGTVPTELEVLAIVRLAEDAPVSVQGESRTVRLEVRAAGLACTGDDAQCPPEAGPPPGSRPGGGLGVTGFGLWPPLLWGVATVLAGIGLARWGSAVTR